MIKRNPKIESISTDDSLDTDSDEELIPKLHFVWLGSALTSNNAKNLPGWIDANSDCSVNIFVWFDSKMLTHDQIQATRKYLDTIVQYEDNVYLCDIRKYKLFHSEYLLNAYEYELGLQPRPGVNDLVREIKNYGMTSDLLRMCILRLYGGFYMDLDMIPHNLCEYHDDDRIKSCPLRFCIALSSEPDYSETEEPEIYYNIYNYYDDYYDYNRVYGEYKFTYHLDEYPFESGDNLGIINNGLYYDPRTDYNDYMDQYFRTFQIRYDNIMSHQYYGYFLNFRDTTIITSGPGVFLKLFMDRHSKEIIYHRKAILRDIYEDENQSTHSWVIVDQYRDIISILMYEIIKDNEQIKLTYSFDPYNSDDQEDEVELDVMVLKILKLFLKTINHEVYELYSRLSIFGEVILNKLVTKILNEKPNIGYYIDLAKNFSTLKMDTEVWSYDNIVHKLKLH